MDSKAVRTIRDAADDEIEFDMAGYSEATATDLMKQCFEKPIDRSSHLKVTLVVGGGKLVRQKYDDKLTKYVTSALKAINFEEDGAADKSSVRAFKSQHDTNKNLKFVHVFPEVNEPEEEKDEDEDSEDDGPVSIHERILRVDLDELEAVLPNRVPSYSEKKLLLAHLKEAQEVFASAEKKMIEMKPLDTEEQTAYDNNVEIAEKITLVNNSIAEMIKEGQLTSKEKKQFVEEMEDKIDKVETQLDAASEKAQKKLKMQLEKLSELKKTAESKDPIPSRPLRRQDEIVKLYVKLYNRQDLEASKENKTVAQLQYIGEIPEIQEALDAHLRSAKGWFESGDDFQDRVRAAESEAKKQWKEKSKKKKAAAASGYGWSTAKKR